MSHLKEKSEIVIQHRDLIAAWTVLENLTASLGEIGRTFAVPVAPRSGDGARDEMARSIQAYLSPELIQQIAEARTRLGQYISDEEAETLSEKAIKYWRSSSVDSKKASA